MRKEKNKANPWGAKNIWEVSREKEPAEQMEKKWSQEFIKVLQSKEKSASEKNWSIL